MGTPSWAQLGSITIATGNEGIVVGIGAGFVASSAEEDGRGFASTAGGFGSGKGDGGAYKGAAGVGVGSGSAAGGGRH
jgi:hypothetical protein